MNKGRLYLIPSLLSEGEPEAVLPAGTIDVLRRLTWLIVEEEKTARRFLIKAGLKSTLDHLTFVVFNEHSLTAGVEHLLEPLNQGIDVGILSEAGVPCVADPGSVIVQAAHQHGIRIVPLTGPSSILLALMASGLNGQQFCFLGYLPADEHQRIKKIRDIELKAITTGQTQIFIETPYRNRHLFQSLIQVCKPATLLCIAVNITGADETIRTLTIREWKNHQPDFHKKNAIFLLGQG